MTDLATARARRGVRSVRHRPRALAWVAALSLALAPVFAPAAAFAETSGTPTPTPSPTPTASGSTSLIAAPAASGLVPSGSDAVFSISQRNTTARTVAAGALSVSLSRTPLASQAEVDAWLHPAAPVEGVEAASPPTLEEVARADVPELGAGDERSTSVSVSAADKDLPGLAPGVYPVAVSGPGGSSHTVITVPRADVPARSIAVVVPITAGPRTTGILSSSDLATLTAADGALTAALDAVTGTPAILAVDPAIPASIRVLGSSAPASATTWLSELMALPNERFALQFGDADLATQIHAGVDPLLAPTTLSPYADIANFAAGDGASGSATAGAAGTVPALGALTAVGTAANTQRAVYWPASGTAGADVVSALDQRAVPASTGGAADTTTDGETQTTPDAAPVSPLTLVPSDTVSTAGASPRASAGGAQLLVYDAVSSLELARAATTDDTTLRGATVAGAMAQLVLTGDSPVVVAVDRPASTTRSALRGAITTAYGVPGATPATLSELRATGGAEATVADIAASDDRVAALQRFLTDEAQLATFATALVEPAQLTARERTAMLQLVGNAWLTDPTGWAAAVTAHEQATQSTFDAVGIANPGTINFLATSAPISVTVRNDLPWPVSVVLFAETGDPRLIVQKATVVDAGAQQNTRIDVPVEARVGSGETNLQLQLRSTSAVPIGASETIGLTVRAEWESVGITAIIVIVVLLFVGGVIRTVLKLRRRGRDDEPTDAAQQDAAQQDATASGAQKNQEHDE